MAKKKENVIELDAEKIAALGELAEKLSDKPLEITSAKLHENKCSYSYELLQGASKGDVIQRKGTNDVHEDLRLAFENMDVFIAQIDGAFKTWANNQTTLQKLESSAELSLYGVTAIKIQGTEENRSVVLVGYKDVDAGRITFETPKIKLEKSTFLYVEELSQRLETLLDEVEQYMNGKIFIEPQYAMTFEEEDDDFEKGKV